MTEILTGQEAVNAASESEFRGYRNPRFARLSESSVDRAKTLLTNAAEGKWGADIKLAEAFSTSDFTMSAFAVVDSEFQAQYEEMPSTWRQYTTVTKVSDFRPKRLIDRRAGHIGFDRVPELTEYPAGTLPGFDVNSIAVAKFGRRYAISWEMWKNNEAVAELLDFPTLLASQAVETESKNAASNLLNVDPATGRANGVNTNFFKAANGNAPDNKPLTYANLKAALTKVKSMKSKDGRPVAVPNFVLVVPVALQEQANAIMAIREVRTTVDGVEIVEGNAVSGTVNVVVEPMLDAINDNAKAGTTWFLLPAPNSTRAAVWAAFLQGHETPDIRVKADQGVAVGGGSLSIEDGSFEIDDIQWRGRHIVGNQTGDPSGTYVSTGS